MGIPVVIAENGIGVPIKSVGETDHNYNRVPLMTVAENGFGMPIVLSDLGAPARVEGGGAPFSRTAAILGAGGLDYALYDSSALDRMWQEQTGQTPVANGNSVGLIVGREKQGGKTFAQVMAGQPELRGTGSTNVNGSPPLPPTYDPATGAGSVSRAVGTSNQSLVRFLGVDAAKAYLVDVECLGTSTGVLTVRDSTGAGTFFSAGAGQRRFAVCLAPGTSISVRCANDNQTLDFIVHSIKEVPAHYASQATPASRPTLQADGIKGDGVDDNLLTDWMAQAGANCIIAQVTVPVTLSGTQVVVGMNGSADAGVMRMAVTTAGLLRVSMPGQTALDGGPDIRGTSAVIALSTDGTLLRSFVNDSQAASGNIGGQPNTAVPFRLGARNNNGVGDVFFGGSIKRIAFGKTALTLEQFQTIRAEWLAAA